MVWLRKTKYWKRFDTSNFELKRSFPKEKKLKDNRVNEKRIRMKGFVVLIAKTYSYLTGDNDKSIKPKGTRNASEKENLNLRITKLFCKYLSKKIKETI